VGLHFEQEVIACSKAVEELIPQTDVAVELGGEDAKITFYGSTIEQRMNGTCAGGTGAFIDQMAILLNTDAQGLNEAAKHYEIIYPIAARCGVFAKTDIQPLINDGAAVPDLASYNQRQGGFPGRASDIPVRTQGQIYRDIAPER
jgi:activator of 2-hydroxyglutaryl-CoA dehydratase